MMRTIKHYGKRDRCLHVETPLGIVNIYVNLTDSRGRRVERVELIGNHCSGEPEVKVDGNRLIEAKSARPARNDRND